ncbi:TPA: MATE family efflux transporter [Streptococcus suis]
MKQESLGKSIIKLALPATMENIFQTLVGFVDTLLIAQLGLVAVTAVGLANTILNVYLAVYIALGVGATALIARSIGAGDKEAVAYQVRQEVVLSLGAGLIWGYQVASLLHSGRDVGAARFKRCRLRSGARFRNRRSLAGDFD